MKEQHSTRLEGYDAIKNAAHVTLSGTVVNETRQKQTCTNKLKDIATQKKHNLKPLSHFA